MNHNPDNAPAFDKEGIDEFRQSFSQWSRSCCRHTEPSQNTTLSIAQSKNGYRHYLTSGLSTLQKVHRDLFGNMASLESVSDGSHCTWWFHASGDVCPQTVLCGFESLSPARTFVSPVFASLEVIHIQSLQ